MNKHGSAPRFRFAFAAVLLAALAFLVPALREGDPFLYMLAVGVTGGMVVCLLILPRLFSLDRFIFTLAVCFSVLPVIALAHIGPDESLSQLLRCLAGIAVLAAGAAFGRLLSASLLTGLAASFIGLLLIAAGLAGDTLQLSLTEAAIPVLLIGACALLSARGGVAALIPGILAAVLLILQDQFLAVLIFLIVFGALLWSSGSCAAWAVPVLLVLLALYYIGSQPHPHMMASGPSGSDASASLSALVSAGLWGKEITAVEVGSFFPCSLLYPLADCFGLIFTGLILLLWLPLTLRGMFIASVARSRFHAYLAMSCALFLALRAIFALLAAFSVIPFPLTDFPLLTSSLPDLCAQFFMLGILCGISGRNEADLAEDAHLAMLAK